MSLRKTGKLLTLVGFVICLSCLGILYGNLSTVVEERDQLANKKSANEVQFKRDAEAKEKAISSLEGELSKAQKEADDCHAEKGSMEDRNTGLMETIESYKDDVNRQSSALKVLQRAKDTEVAALNQIKAGQAEEIARYKEELATLRQTVESSSSCASSVEALQTQISRAREQIHVLETQLSTCAENANSNADPTMNDSEDQNHVVPVAAMPNAAEPLVQGGEAMDAGDVVAALPNQPDSGKSVDNLKEIPEAQAPAPGMVHIPEQPVVPAENVGAVVPAPVQPRDQESYGGDSIGDQMLEPLQPIGEDLLADSLERVQQAEQLRQLQDRQQQQVMLPNLQSDGEPGPNNFQPEFQPAQPPPHEM